MYLQRTINGIVDPELHSQYLKLLVKYSSVEDIALFAKVANLSDPLAHCKQLSQKFTQYQEQQPLLILCGRYGLSDFFLEFIFKIEYHDLYIEYVKYNPHTLPIVAEFILDRYNGDDHKNDLLSILLNNFASFLSNDEAFELVTLLEKYEKIYLIIPWIKSMLATNSPKYDKTFLANVIAKSLPLSSVELITFLKQNPHYDRKLMGNFFEGKKKYHLASICYSAGELADELMGLSMKTSQYSELIPFLLKKRDSAKWSSLLSSASLDKEDFLAEVFSLFYFVA